MFLVALQNQPLRSVTNLHEVAASLQKVTIRDRDLLGQDISLTEDETSDPFVCVCEWALAIGIIHLAWYCASDANRTV